jgi:hypothetical protein
MNIYFILVRKSYSASGSNFNGIILKDSQDTHSFNETTQESFVIKKTFKLITSFKKTR